MTIKTVIREALPVLLVLYPLLLLLDDLEPGFVRSVVNPHWFLLALIVVGMIAGPEMASSPLALRRAQGISRSALVFVAAIVMGFWVWWRVGGGRIGAIVGFLAAVAIAGVVMEIGRGAGGQNDEARMSNDESPPEADPPLAENPKPE